MATRKPIPRPRPRPWRLSEDLSTERGQDRGSRQLIDTYQRLEDADKTLSAASRLLQVDPNNMKAIFISVFIKKCAKSVIRRPYTDPQTCDDAATLAQKGLNAKACRHLRRRVEEADGRNLSGFSLGDRFGRRSLQEGLQGRDRRIHGGIDALLPTTRSKTAGLRTLSFWPRPIPSPTPRIW